MGRRWRDREVILKMTIVEILSDLLPHLHDVVVKMTNSEKLRPIPVTQVIEREVRGQSASK